jgi:hypothetical protein
VPGRPPQNRSVPDQELPAGTILVEVVDEKGQPIKNATVKLLTSYQSVAEGNSEDIKTLTTNEQGQATFDGLDGAIRFTYAASVTRDGATYDIPGFRLSKVGQRVVVHTYPVTADPKAAFVGIQAFITVQVNDDLIRTDAVYRVINMSRSTWLPKPIFLRLPADSQGVEAKLTSGDAGFEKASGGVNMLGSFPPGQKDVMLAFYVPNTNEETRSISFGVPPHSVDLNVLTEEAPGMGLSVSPAFQPTESRTGRNQKKVLITRRMMRPGEGQLGSIQIQLSGLPVIGPGRWYASGLAVLIALIGLAGAWMKRSVSQEEETRQKDKAREALLDEMLVLQSAHDRGDIGPRTYEQTKREIMAALARLEPAAS